MGKIIVVEDNLVYSGYVCNFLKGNGYRTVSTWDCARPKVVCHDGR